MAQHRYEIRREPDGTWTVFDVFTGWPAEVDGHLPATGLDMEEADDLLDLLNLGDLLRRGSNLPL